MFSIFCGPVLPNCAWFQKNPNLGFRDITFEQHQFVRCMITYCHQKRCDYNILENHVHSFLAWGTLSTQGIVILSGVVRPSCVRRVSVVTNRVTGQNLRTSIGIGLLFFFESCVSLRRSAEQKKIWEKVWKKGVKSSKKVWNR